MQCKYKPYTEDNMGPLTGFTQTEKSVEKEGVAGRGVIWLWLA